MGQSQRRWATILILMCHSGGNQAGGTGCQLGLVTALGGQQCRVLEATMSGSWRMLLDLPRALCAFVSGCVCCSSAAQLKLAFLDTPVI